MKIGILTSSRADFGIYYPLVKKMWEDHFFEVEIIAFGTHLKKEYGYTINEILKSGFDVKHRIITLTDNNEAADIAKSIGDAIIKFSAFWKKQKFDLVFALGDRYEMFAAVSAASPFNIKIAHIHAGETTLGAIDNAYRHSISLMSNYHFVSTEEYKIRAIEISKQEKNAFNVGALSIDNLKTQTLYTKKEFLEEFHIDLNIPTLLSTFHPETVSYEKNNEYIIELLNAFKQLESEYQIVITMPNSDTMGDMIRQHIMQYAYNNKNVKTVESFGMKGYLSCMKHSFALVGNTSSGFVEAAFFPKWVINLGNRQDGRIITENILNIDVKKTEIIKAIKTIKNKKSPSNTNIYGKGDAADKIIEKIKEIYGNK